MTAILDLTGSAYTEIRVPVSSDAREELTRQGVDAPEYITLRMRDASVRERENLARDQQKGGRAETDTYQWFTALLMRRAAPGTDERVVAELVKDMGGSDMARFMAAYLSGNFPDPKATAQVVSTTLNGMTNNLLGLLSSAVPSPSSSTSTASSPGTSPD